MRAHEKFEQSPPAAGRVAPAFRPIAGRCRQFSALLLQAQRIVSGARCAHIFCNPPQASVLAATTVNSKLSPAPPGPKPKSGAPRSAPQSSNRASARFRSRHFTRAKSSLCGVAPSPSNLNQASALGSPRSMRTSGHSTSLSVTTSNLQIRLRRPRRTLVCWVARSIHFRVERLLNCCKQSARGRPDRYTSVTAFSQLFPPEFFALAPTPRSSRVSPRLRRARANPFPRRCASRRPVILAAWGSGVFPHA